MSFLQGKKKIAVALAEIIEDGREKSNEEMKKTKYNHYQGQEPLLSLKVRVLPRDNPPFEAQMKTGLTLMYLLKPGVQVQVSYDPRDNRRVNIEDNVPAILARNPQLLQKPQAGI